jgi:GrpB-like predicted nucleotidyltransferase (UPF0157 family)
VARDDHPHPLSFELVPSRHDAWRAEFDAFAGELRAALGDRAVAIDHIGSTSIPGLAAKDGIDIQVRVADLGGIELDAFDMPLGAGVVHDHVPDGWSGSASDWEKLYFRRLDPRRIHVHVRRVGSPNARYALLFRDYLRGDDDARQRWGAVKRDLAERFPERDAYAEAKDPLTDVLMADAERWAVDTGWSPPAH